MTTLDGRYELGERLGGGATADVFRAHDSRLGRDVAVKVFHRVAALPDARDRLESEVRLLASLTHPNLVALYDAEIGAEPYVVMELVEGASLADQIRAPMEPRRAARLGAEVAAGLAYVHARGIVHRDVKPANVLLTREDRAKVADFGIARLVDDSGLTQAGLVVGTAAYLAPEQVRGRAVAGSADVYSLGLVLLEALTAHREYDGPATEAAGARLHRAPTIPASLGGGWGSLLAAMTATDPADRPAAAEVGRRLAELASAGSTAATRAVVAAPAPTAVIPRTTTVPAYDPDPAPRRGWLIAAVLAVLVIAAIVVAVVLANRTSSNTPTTPPTTPTPSTATTPSPTPTPTPTTPSPTPTPTPTATTPTATPTSPTTPTPTSPSASSPGPVSSSGPGVLPSVTGAATAPGAAAGD